MYLMPQMIWVAGLVRQSLPSLAIFEPGRACGMPYAPELGLVAFMSHLLSRMMMLLKQSNWLDAVSKLVLQDLPGYLLGIGDTRLVATIGDRSLRGRPSPRPPSSRRPLAWP